jgi:hypothetical protein
MPEYYGDLNDPRDVEVCIQSAVFALKPIFIALRRWRKPFLCSDYEVKMVILKGSTRTARYRCFPVR